MEKDPFWIQLTSIFKKETDVFGIKATYEETNEEELGTEHLKKNKKDFGTQKALLDLVGKRRSLLDYYKKKDIVKYRELIKELNIRK